MGLNLISWNAQSISAHSAELKEYIQSAIAVPDIICVQESFLIDSSKFRLKGYDMEAKNRQVKKGGVAIFIKNGINYSRIDNIPGDLEGVSIKFETANRSMIVSNVYLTRDTDIQLIRNILGVPNHIVCGDFNAKNTLWGSPINDNRGKDLEDLIDEFGMTVINTGRGTRINNDGSYSHLDLTLVSNNISAKCSWTTIDDTWGSDHLPTLIGYGEMPLVEDGQIEKFVFSKADWSAYHATCKVKLTETLLGIDTEESCANITNVIIQTAEECIPKRKNGRKKKCLPFWNENCKKAVQNKRRAKANMDRTKSQDDCIAYRQAKALAQRTIRQSEKDSWRNYCSTLEKDTKLTKVWNMIKSMSGIRTNRQISNIKEGDVTHVRNLDKANALARGFANISSDQNFEPEFLAKKATFEKAPDIMDVADSPLNDKIEMHEFAAAIGQCKRQSAPGEDMITYDMIKKLPKSCKMVVLKLFNQIWEGGSLPNSWKHSIVLPFVKPNKDPTTVNSYRPIALTSSLCKLNERVIANRLAWHMEINKLFNVNQAGFRKNRSTIDQIMRLQNDIQNSINHCEYTIGIFLDFTKAYDMLWKDGLLSKLSKYDIKGNMYKWIENFLTDRTFQVRVSNVLSDRFKLENGTPQGSVVSPILFLIMINDLPTLPVKTNTKTAIYADDTAIWKSGKDLDKIIETLQKNLDKILVWCQTWGFILSKDKSIAVIFSRQRDLSTRLQFKIGQTPVKFEKEVKFLGMIFDERLSWKAHIDYVVDKCKKRLNLMRSISGTTWGADKSSLLTIYKALIRSILDYGCIAFNSATKESKDKLDRVQHQALRICCGAMKCSSVAALEVECGEQPLKLRREGLQNKYGIRITHIEGHPTAVILSKCRPIKIKQTSFKKETKDFLKELPRNIEGPKISQSPPWHMKPIKVDMKLLNMIEKQQLPAGKKQTALEHINKYYSDYTKCYTDGSKKEHLTGSAFYIEGNEVRTNYRVTDDIDISTAEMVAIREAVKHIIDRKYSKAIIFSDSACALQSIKAGKSQSRPNLLLEIKSLLNESQKQGQVVEICWLPGHTEIAGNDTADTLAKEALQKNAPDLQVPLELKEAYKIAEKSTKIKWQKEWNECQKGRHYFSIEPIVSDKVKYLAKDRKKETTITRLRLGKCGLNHILHQISVHSTGLCDTCAVPETIEHYLMQCQNNEELIKHLRDEAIKNGDPLEVKILLGKSPYIDIIYEFSKTQDRKL